MIGLSKLAQTLSSVGNDEIVLWLESGLRTVLDAKTPEGIELSFSPLILSRDAPPLQQFHVAVEALPGAVQARLRWACSALLASLRAQDDVRYVACLWSVAIALKPPTGVIVAARHFLQQIGGAAPNIREEYRRVVNFIVTAALTYPRSGEHDSLVSDIRAYDLWIARYSEQFIIFLVASQRKDWPDILRTYKDEIFPLSDRSSGFIRRLVGAIGPAELGRSIYLLNQGDGLDWLWPAVHPHASLQFRGDCLYVEVGSASVSIPEADIPNPTTDDQIMAILVAVDTRGPNDEADARARMASTLSTPRMQQIEERRAL